MCHAPTLQCLLAAKAVLHHSGASQDDSHHVLRRDDLILQLHRLCGRRRGILGLTFGDDDARVWPKQRIVLDTPVPQREVPAQKLLRVAALRLEPSCGTELMVSAPDEQATAHTQGHTHPHTHAVTHRRLAA